MTYPCPAPQFEIQSNGTWSACIGCGRLAWDHEQSDPAQDIRNFIAAIRDGRDPSLGSPVMRGMDAVLAPPGLGAVTDAPPPGLLGETVTFDAGEYDN
jgi:hypothetical protein